MKIDPRTVMVAIPAYDGKIVAELAGSLVSAGRLFGALSIPTGVSHVSLVRNIIAARFMASAYEWLVCIDSDIVPSPRDFELLLEPCDLETVYIEEVEEGRKEKPALQVTLPPRPTRIVTALCQENEAGQVQIESKMVGAADALVCAEYAYKNDLLEPVKLGMGFVRIHRSVFEALNNLKHEKSEEYAQAATIISSMERSAEAYEEIQDNVAAAQAKKLRETIQEMRAQLPPPDGEPRLWQISHQGRMFYDYYPSGPLISMFVPTAEWKGEDHGFWTLCMLAGMVPRVETRTKLAHVGTKAYVYEGPDVGGGQ